MILEIPYIYIVGQGHIFLPRKGRNVMKTKYLAAGLGGLLLCLGGLLFSKELAQGIRNGSQICCSSLIPSLFFFMALSGLISKTRMGESLCRPFAAVIRRLLPVSAQGASIYFLSLLGGYPVGAQLIGQGVRQGSLSPKEGEYLLCFCVNCSPAFLISGVAVHFWNSLPAGVILYTSQAAASLAVAWLARPKEGLSSLEPAKEDSRLPISAALVEAVSRAVHSMALICGFVILFCGCFSLLDQLPLPDWLQIPLKGALEVTSGCQFLGELPPPLGMLLGAGLTAFGGVCVFCQVSAMLRGSGLSTKKFFLWRGFYTLISVMLTWAGMLLFRPRLEIPAVDVLGGQGWEAYSVSPASGICLVALGAACVLFFAERTKERTALRSQRRFSQNSQKRV